MRILTYHGIECPNEFARQMEHLVRHYRPISAGDLVDLLDRGAGLPERSVLVTFDDGCRTVLEHAAPVLGRLGIPAVAFVVAGLIDRNDPFWWDEAEALALAGASSPTAPVAGAQELVRHLKTVPDPVRRLVLEDLRRAAPMVRVPGRHMTSADLSRLQQFGVEIGNHTWSHPCLTRCSSEAVAAEISRAHDHLTEVLGGPPRLFAYPNGDWDERAVAAVAAHGYRAAFQFDHRLSWPRQQSRLLLSRLRVSTVDSPERFRAVVAGSHPIMHRMLGRA